MGRRKRHSRSTRKYIAGLLEAQAAKLASKAGPPRELPIDIPPWPFPARLEASIVGPFLLPVAIVLGKGAEGHGRWLALEATSGGTVLVYALKWGKGGKLVSGGPKGWNVLRHRDTATRKGDYHYHCEKDGDEYTVRANGQGSHNTKSGTVLPNTLGDFLSKELGVDVHNVDDKFVVRFLPMWSWDPRLEEWAVEFVTDAMNATAGR